MFPTFDHKSEVDYFKLTFGNKGFLLSPTTKTMSKIKIIILSA